MRRRDPSAPPVKKSRVRRLSPGGWVVGLALAWVPTPSLYAVTVDLYAGDDVSTLTKSLRPGDEFIFHEGEYPLAATLTWSGVGEATSPITFRAAEGEKPVLVGGSYPITRIAAAAWMVVDGLTFQGAEGWDSGEVSYDGLQVDNSSYITLTNLEIRQIPGTALYLNGTCDTLTVERNHLHDIIRGHGIYAGCYNASCATSNTLISNNWIHNLISDSGRAIELAPGSFNNLIVDNVMYGGGSRGILTSSTSYGEPNLIERNAVWSFVNSGIRADGPAIVRNNVIFNINGAGLASRWTDVVAPEGPIIFAYNTVVNTTAAAALLEQWSLASDVNNVFSSNALTNVTGIALDGDIREGHYFSNNVVVGLVDLVVEGYSPGGGLDDYMDAEIWDFWPSDNSHLLNAGDTTAEGYLPPEDFNKQARPGDAPDTGALERTSPSNTGWLIKEGFKEDVDTSGEGETADIEGGCGCGGADETGDNTPAAASTGLGGLLVLWARRRPRRSI